MGKKKIKLMLLGAMDKLEQVNATQVEKTNIRISVEFRYVIVRN